MNIVNITLGVDTQPCSSITLGRRGENEVTQVVIDFSSWAEEFGAGVITLLAMRSQDTSAYPVVLSLDGNTATWDVTSTDTAYKGSGRAEYIYTVGEQIAKSVVFNTVVMQDIGEPSETPPDPYEEWLERLTELGAETQSNAEAAQQSAENAEQSAQEAAESAASVEGAVEQAEAARDAAQSAQAASETARDAAQTAQASAETSATAASGSATSAAGSASDASSSASAAGSSATTASAAAGQAEAAKTAAQTAQQAAEQAAQQAHVEYEQLSGEVDDLSEDVSQQKSVLNENVLFACQAEIPRSYWIRKAGLNTSGAAVTNAARAVTWGSLASAGAPVKVVSLNDNIQIIFYSSQTGGYIGDYASEAIAVDPTGIRVVARTVDDSEITGDALDDIHIFTSYDGKTNLTNYFVRELTTSNRFPAYNADGTYTTRYKIDTTDGNAGCLLRNNTTSRATFCELISPNDDVTVWCGQFNTSTLTVVIGGQVVATLPRGGSYTIPKGTRFICGFTTTNQLATNNVETTCFYIVHHSIPEKTQSQLISGTTLSGQDTCFLVGDKLFAIGRENTGFSIKQGTTWIVSTQPLGQNVGHANSCNYDADTKRAYVSDWTDPATIHVFDVDAEANTMTFAETITMPIQEGRGSTEYFVFDNENQVFFLGWQVGNSATDPNVLVYGLYVKTSTGYVLAWERYAKRAVCIQSMTVQDGYIYYVEVDPANSYHTIGVNRINIATGATEYGNAAIAGSLTTVEAEGISPIGKQAFEILARDGTTYLVLFAKKEDN